MTDDKHIDGAAALERARKAVDPVMDTFALSTIVTKFNVMEVLGLIPTELRVDLENSYLAIRDHVCPDIKPGHILFDKRRDLADKSVELGDKVWWKDFVLPEGIDGPAEDKKRKGTLVYRGKPFSRQEICPPEEGGWLEGERPGFIIACTRERLRIKSGFRRLCLSGCVVKVRRFKKTRKGRVEIKPAYYCPESSALRLVAPKPKGDS